MTSYGMSEVNLVTSPLPVNTRTEARRGCGRTGGRIGKEPMTVILKVIKTPSRAVKIHRNLIENPPRILW